MPTRACGAPRWRASATRPCSPTSSATSPTAACAITRSASWSSRRRSTTPRVATPAVAALASLGRERELATVAKAAGPDAVRRAAIAAVRDEKALGSIAPSRRRSRRAAAGRRAADRRRRDRRRGAARRARRRGGGRRRSPASAVERDADGDRQKARTKAAQKKARTLLQGQPSRRRRRPTAVRPTRTPISRRARDLVAQMKALASRRRLRRSCARRMPPARVAWVELLADADIQSDHRGRLRERVGRRARAAGRGRSRARRSRAPAPGASSRSRPIAPPCARTVEGLARRRHRRPARRGARDVGRHAGDARERGPRSSIAGSPKPAAPPRSATSAGSWPSRSAERLPTLVPEIEALAGQPSTTATFAASGTRCASSGRRSRATSRSTPS